MTTNLIPDIARLEPGEGGLPRITVSNRFANAEIYLLGAHVTRFLPVGEAQPVLWMSAKSPFIEGKGIRGGVPICWPWFGPRKDMLSHGCVRNRSWHLVSAAQLSDGRTRLELGIEHSAETLAQWPHEFSLRMAVTVGATLDVALTTTNTSAIPFNYDDALHTYFSVSDVHQVTVSGFDGLPFIDRIPSVARKVQDGAIAFTGETDRVYLTGPVTGTTTSVINDPAWKRRIVITATGSRATVVWNPWTGKGMEMPEVQEQWPGFVCVEHANCLDVPITLLPGTAHTTAVSYGVER
jgi:D-hexose-6-phosphate mutarotase